MNNGLKTGAVMLFWPAFYLGLWEVLLAAQNPGLMTDDSGEIAASAACLGVGHGPGFPMYILAARLAGFVPIGTPVFRLNLLAAFFTLLAVFFVVSACRELAKKLQGKAPSAILIRELWLVFTALSLLFCESVFAQSLTAKGGIYTLTLLGSAVMLWACAREGKDTWPLWLLFLWAAGMGNHWPFQVFFLALLGFRFGPELMKWSQPRILAGASFVLTGFSVFLYLPLRAMHSPALNWEDPRAFGAFWSVVARKSAPAGEFASRSLQEYGRNLMEYLQVMGWHWWPGFALLAAAGAWFLFRRQRGLALAVIAAYALLTAAIVRVAHFDDATLYLETNYLVATQAAPALLGFAGALALFGRWMVTRPRTGLVLALAGVLAAASWGAAVFERQQKSRFTLAEDLGTNLLKELPRDAVVLLDSDVISMPALYQRYALGKRPDLTVALLPLLSAKWGFTQAFSEYRERFTDPGAIQGFQDAVRLFMDSKRIRCSGVFYACYKKSLEEAGMGDLAGKLSPWGLSYRLQGGQAEPFAASSDVWAVASRQRLRNLKSARNLPGTEFACDVYRSHYSRGNVEAGNLLLDNDLLYPAARHFQKALEVYPSASGVYLKLAKYFKARGYQAMFDVLLSREFENRPELDEGKKAAMRYLTAPPPRGVSIKTNPEDYLALGKKYEQDGEPWLAAVAQEAARAGQTGNK